jgi:hypothetical protein
MSLPTKDIVSQVKYLTSPLKFFIYCDLVVAGFALGLASLSKLEPGVTNQLVMALFYLFILMISISFGLVAYNPKRYLYTREEWSKIDNLTDSNAAKSDKPVSSINVTAKKVELPNDSNLENQ